MDVWDKTERESHMILKIGRLWILSLIVLMSVGLAGCAGSLARDVADASNRPGGLFAVDRNAGELAKELVKRLLVEPVMVKRI